MLKINKKPYNELYKILYNQECKSYYSDISTYYVVEKIIVYKHEDEYHSHYLENGEYMDYLGNYNKWAIVFRQFNFDNN